MKVKLIRVLSEEDNNGSTKFLAKYFKDVKLLIKPQLNTWIEIGNISFFIHRIEQDLNTQTVLLYEDKDIFYRYNRNDEGFKKEREILLSDGWKLL